jgi:hypothetical protein
MTTIVNGNANSNRLLPILMSESSLGLPAIVGFALVVALTFYCQVSAVVEHGNVTWGASIAWAIKVSAGWIVVSALLWRFGPDMFSWGSSQRHPRTMLAALFLACCVITLLLDFATSSEIPVLDFLFRRLPAVMLGNLLLIGAVCLVELRRGQMRQTARDEVQTNEGVSPATIEVMTGTGRATVHLREIECFEADGNYLNVIHKTGRRYLLRKTLQELQEQLDQRFSRVHRSAIVNLDAVVERRSGAILVFSSGHTVRMSRRFSAVKRHASRGEGP